MNLRLLILRLLLSCMLLGAQQMGWTHALSHLRIGSTTGNTTGNAARSAGPASASGKSASGALQADKACEQCLAFAQIDAMLGGCGVGPMADFPPVSEQPLRPQSGMLPVTACVFQSRAPPQTP